MCNRRNFLLALAAGAFALAPRLLFAQAKQPILIGWLRFGSRESSRNRLFAAFKEGLAALGWKEGSHVRFEERWSDGQDDRLMSLARELAAKNPTLIIASGLSAATAAAKSAPKIPIVMVVIGDPVASGLVTSLGRPGGLITGIAGFSVEIAGKSVELLLAAAPKVKRIGFLGYANSPNRVTVMDVARRSVAQYKVDARFAEVASPEEIEPAILRLAKEGAQALVVLPGSLLAAEHRRIVRLGLAQSWPVVAGPRSFARVGALLSYGSDPVASHRRAAYYVDRILKGAKPGDIPIEQPTTFEFVVNLKTAKALGLTMPPEIMVRADRVIE